MKLSWKFKERLQQGFFITLAAAIVGGLLYMVAYSIWYDYQNPCVRWRTWKCESTRCSYMDADGYCWSWTTDEDTCSECVERRPRTPSQAAP